MSRHECRREGGTQGGGCGMFGICCIVQRTCGARVTRKVSYLENLSTTNNRFQSCSYTILPSSSKVCQVRLDFETFSLAQPRAIEGTCLDDWAVFRDITLCGENSGQHIYLPLNYTDGARQIDFTFNLADRQAPGTNLPQARWRIKVTQLECPDRPSTKVNYNTQYRNNHQKTDDTFWIAPPGCLQYFPQRDGEFWSFNLQSGGDSGPYLANLDYAICFRREDNMRRLEFNTNVFEIARLDGAVTDPAFNDECANITPGVPNTGDYLEIPGGTVDGVVTTILCGRITTEMLAAAGPGPLYVRFVSDGFKGQDPETGFRIQYHMT